MKPGPTVTLAGKDPRYYVIAMDDFGLPMWVRRRPRGFGFERAPVWIGVGASVVLVGAIVVSGATARPLPGWLPTLWVAVMFGALLPIRLLVKRLAQERVIRERGLICEACHYPLAGLAAEGACPECNTTYSSGELVMMWRCGYGVWGETLGARLPRKFGVERAMIWACCGIAALLLAGLLANAFGVVSLSDWFGVEVSIAGMAASLLPTIGLMVARKKIERERGMLCACCHQSLAGLAESGKCPECGTGYLKGELVEIWESAYGVELG